VIFRRRLAVLQLENNPVWDKDLFSNPTWHVNPVLRSYPTTLNKCTTSQKEHKKGKHVRALPDRVGAGTRYTELCPERTRCTEPNWLLLEKESAHLSQHQPHHLLSIALDGQPVASLAPKNN
jgi:hypothetical protein